MVSVRRACGAEAADALFCVRKPSVTRQISYQEWQYTSVSGELETFLLPGSAAFGYMIYALWENDNNNITESFWRVNNFRVL